MEGRAHGRACRSPSIQLTWQNGSRAIYGSVRGGTCWLRLLDVGAMIGFCTGNYVLSANRERHIRPSPRQYERIRRFWVGWVRLVSNSAGRRRERRQRCEATLEGL